LRFIKDRFATVFITFDLDAEESVERSIQALGFERRRTYLPIRVEAPGKKNIEGLLPERVRTAVYAENADVVDALNGTNTERRDARARLKRLLLERFKTEARAGVDYEGLYEVAWIINRAVTAARGVHSPRRVATVAPCAP
jgi:hypothetical protein